jgi:hypothetical protein
MIFLIFENPVLVQNCNMVQQPEPATPQNSSQAGAQREFQSQFQGHEPRPFMGGLFVSYRSNLPRRSCAGLQAGSALLLKNIPHTVECENITRSPGVFLQFLSQVRHINVNVVGAALIFGSPHIRNDLFKC